MSSPITVEAVVGVSPEKVWEYWIGPEHITKWCQASDDWHAPAAENDVRVGGRFTTVMAAKDGSAKFDFAGAYTAVEPAALLEYRMDDGRMCRVTFAAVDGGTRVTETFDPESENAEELQRAGWQAILDSFKKYAESRSSIADHAGA